MANSKEHSVDLESPKMEGKEGGPEYMMTEMADLQSGVTHGCELLCFP